MAAGEISRIPAYDAPAPVVEIVHGDGRVHPVRLEFFEPALHIHLNGTPMHELRPDGLLPLRQRIGEVGAAGAGPDDGEVVMNQNVGTAAGKPLVAVNAYRPVSIGLGVLMA